MSSYKPTPVHIKTSDYKNDQMKFSIRPDKKNPKEKRVFAQYGAGNNPLWLQLPVTTLQTELSYYQDNKESTPSLGITLDASNPKMVPVIDALNQIDEIALDFIHANAGPLMGKAGKSKEFLRDLMKKTIVYSKDKTTGEVKPYPPKIYMKVYNDVVMKNPDKSVISDSVNSVLRTGTVMTAIIQPTGISFQKGTISVQYKLAATQIIEHAKSSTSADFDIIDDDAPATAVAPVAPVASVASGGAGGPAAEVEEDEEEEIITPAPAAAPAEEESEEEEILPPQPTPPAKKKVVPAKKAAAK